MTIIELIAENFKRLTAVAIRPKPGVNPITGKNGAGKSSVLDSIEAAFGGAKHSPQQPVRRGAEFARVVIETEELKITRRWSAKGGDSLVVESKDGAIFRSPQALLDRLTSGLSFDPLAFARMPPKEQARLLREMTGCDTSELDELRKGYFDQRTEAGRLVKGAQARVAACVVGPDPGDVGTEIDIAQVAEKKAEAERRRAENARLRRQASECAKDKAAAEDEVRRLESELAKARVRLAATLTASREADEALLGLTDPDTSAIDQEIADAKAHNAQVRGRFMARQTYDRETRANACAECGGEVVTEEEWQRRQDESK